MNAKCSKIRGGQDFAPDLTGDWGSLQCMQRSHKPPSWWGGAASPCPRTRGPALTQPFWLQASAFRTSLAPAMLISFRRHCSGWLGYFRPRQSYYCETFSMAVLTLNSDLDLAKLMRNLAEMLNVRPNFFLWKSDLFVVIEKSRRANERTNELAT